MVISEVNLEIDEDLESLQLPTFRNLRIYFDDSSPTFFDILENSKAIELCIDNKCSARYTNFDPVKKFIKSQEHLKSLALMYFSINTNLFMDNMLDFVKFRLKKFSMNSVYLGMENVARFQTFMMNHIDTLTTLHVQSPFLDISFFRQFLTLKELQISHTNPFFDSFKNIEILTVENVSGNWMVKFPYVRDLTMIYKYGVFLGMYSDLINLVHLQHLTIIDSKIPELNIPSVCSLSLKNVTICAKRPFRFEDNQIKELNIDSCSSIDWIADFLALESTRLKVLRIRNMNLKELIVTEKEKEKIQTLTFINS
ncbi:unnamed protein product [Chironomus riparius]|uniref:Uncharacterized protein n=1 Tax=Chironomus riparius TaxID=315576 RepID=A0A9N9S5Z2_9DIPT|nr:unnamed protein product [Chironomus riparius]